MSLNSQASFSGALMSLMYTVEKSVGLDYLEWQRFGGVSTSDLSDAKTYFTAYKNAKGSRIDDVHSQKSNPSNPYQEFPFAPPGT